MIKQFSGYEEAKKVAQSTGGAKLPVGAYVCKIIGVKLEETKILVQYDVCEGEYADFFQKKYRDSKEEDKKYKGIAKLWLPKDDGSEKDTNTKNKFARWTNALEESNPGYRWDWDETKWKDKYIGILYGEVGQNIDGKNVRYNTFRDATSIDKVRSGEAKIPKFYAYAGYEEKPTTTANTTTDFMSIPDGIEEEIPFK